MSGANQEERFNAEAKLPQKLRHCIEIISPFFTKLQLVQHLRDQIALTFMIFIIMQHFRHLYQVMM